MSLQEDVGKIARILQSLADGGALKIEQVAPGIEITDNNTLSLMMDFYDSGIGPRWNQYNDGASGTIVALNEVGGWISIPTAAADNDYNGIWLASRAFSLNKETNFSAEIRLAEANTDDANWFVGLSAATPVLQNDGAVLANTFNGFGFYKLDGGTAINFRSGDGTAPNQVNSAAVAPFVSNSVYTLSFRYAPTNPTTGVLRAYVNGSMVATQNVTVSSSAVASPVLEVKAGGAAVETLRANYIKIDQAR